MHYALKIVKRRVWDRSGAGKRPGVHHHTAAVAALMNHVATMVVEDKPEILDQPGVSVCPWCSLVGYPCEPSSRCIPAHHLGLQMKSEAHARITPKATSHPGPDHEGEWVSLLCVTDTAIKPFHPQWRTSERRKYTIGMLVMNSATPVWYTSYEYRMHPWVSLGLQKPIDLSDRGFEHFPDTARRLITSPSIC